MRRMKIILVVLALFGIVSAGCMGPSTKVYSVRGTVRDGEGNVLSNVELLATFGDQTDRVSTGLDGEFCFEQLSGSAKIVVEGQAGKKIIPAYHGVNSKKEGADFTVHTVFDYDQPVSLPQSRMIFFADLALDFSETDLESAPEITVKHSGLAALEEMEAAGPILEIELEEEFEGKVALTLPAESAESWLFRYDQQNDLWYPLISVSHEAGQLKAQLSGFSCYGVFKAPQAAAPRADRDPGAYPGGSKVELLGDLIYYTTDGSEPDNFSSFYETALAIEAEGLQLKAINIAANRRPSPVVDWQYSIDQSSQISYISGPSYVSLSNTKGVAFSLDRGVMTEDRLEIDLELDYSMHSHDEYRDLGLFRINGVLFKGPQPGTHYPTRYIEQALEQFRSLEALDWEESSRSQKFPLNTQDSLVIKTRSGRLAKLFVFSLLPSSRFHIDAPTISFAYQFLDEIDLEPPVLQSITVTTKNGASITKTSPEGIVEFEVASSDTPDKLIFEFDELVYGNRGLTYWFPNPYFGPSAALFFYPRNDLFHGQDSIQYCENVLGIQHGFSFNVSSGNWDGLELAGGDEQFWTKYWSDVGNTTIEDLGFHFSDLAGNRMFEFPFEKIVLIEVE